MHNRYLDTLRLFACAAALSHLAGCGNDPDGATNPDGGTPGANCVVLSEQPVAASSISWSGSPACDSSGFCVVYPAPMNSLTSVSASPSGTNWAVYQNLVAAWKGAAGQVYRFDIDDNADIADIVAISDTNVWIVGSASAVIHYDGTRWTNTMLTNASALSSVWASSASDVWTVGNFGVVGHYDGSKWSSQTLSSSVNLSAVFGTGPQDVWAAGSKVEHYNGTSWSEVAISGAPSFKWGWAAATDDVWLLTSGGSVMRGSATSGFTAMSAQPTLSGTTSYRIWGTSKNDVWISTSGDSVHWNGTAWAQVKGGGAVITGRGPADLVAVSSSAAQTFDGTMWKSAFELPAATLRSAWAVTPDDVWFVGDKGMVLHEKNGALLRSTLGTLDLYAVWSSSASDILISDRNHTLYRGDGRTFCPTVLPVPDYSNISEISGTGASDVWAVSLQGPTLHYDGQSWTHRGDLGVDHIFALGPSDVWASKDALYHWDGSMWNTTIASTGFGSDFGPIWGATASDVWTSQNALSGGQSWLHFDGTQWGKTADPGQTTGTLSGSASNDVWSIGFYHLHWDGAKWTRVQTPRLGEKAIAVTAKDVWAAGLNGLVLRKTK